jgi:uncharacterized membrane protein (DUF2068 family)
MVKGESMTSLGSRLGLENKGMFTAFIFYAAAGIVLFALLLTIFAPQLGIMGIFSLIAAYGLFRKRSWTIWFVIVQFFTATAFSASQLYYSLFENLFISLGAVAYLLLTWLFTAYTVSERDKLEN